MKNIVLFASVLRIALISLIMGFAIYANAQSVALNTTGNSADGSAMLDVSSTSKGFLPPRMTTIQRTAIPTPANGLIVFDTDTKTYWYFSTTWKEITNGAGGGSFALPYLGVADNTAPVFSITNTNTSFNSIGLFGRVGNTPSGVAPLGNAGVWGDNAGGIGIAGTSKSIGVYGATGLNDLNGIGVLGISSATSPNLGAVTAINQSKGNAVYAESLDSGTAVYGKTTKQNGAAIYGINNSAQGHGIRGAAAGNDGVGVYGDAGLSNSNSYAAYFRNWNAVNSKNVVQIDNLGTGNFLALTNGLGDTKTIITKNGSISTDGNIFTDGVVVVKGNKGIVRNSNGNQLRVEELTINIPGFTYSHFDSDWGPGEQTLTITFTTPFLSPPVVYKGNCSAGALLSGLSVEFYDVTTTGCKMFISNWGPYDLTRIAGVYKALAMGTE